MCHPAHLSNSALRQSFFEIDRLQKFNQIVLIYIHAVASGPQLMVYDCLLRYILDGYTDNLFPDGGHSFT